MKALIFNFAWTSKDILASLGLEHKKVEEFSDGHAMMDLIEDIIDAGGSVMIEKNHNEPNVDYILYIDKHGKKFRQR